MNQAHQKDLLSACQAVAAETGIDHAAHVGELQTILSHPSVVKVLELAEKQIKAGKSGALAKQGADVDYTKQGDHLLRMTLWGVSGLCRLVIQKCNEAGVTPSPFVVMARDQTIKLLQRSSATPTPTVTPTPTPTLTVSPSPTETESPTPTPTPTDAPSPTPDSTAPVSPTPEATDTVSPTPTPSPTDSAVSPTPEVTDTVSPSPTPSPTDSAVSPTPDVAASPTKSPDPTVTRRRSR